MTSTNKNLSTINKTLNKAFTYTRKTKYEITVNHDDSYQFIDHTKEDLTHVKRFKSYYDMIHQYLIQIFDRFDIKYELYIELSEPKMCSQFAKGKPASSRLHCHGTIEFPTNKSIGLWLLNSFHLLGTHCDVQINEYRPDYWPEYCRKQSRIISTIIKEIKSTNKRFYRNPIVNPKTAKKEDISRLTEFFH